MQSPLNYYRHKMHEVLACMPPCQRMSSGIEHRVGLGDALQPESVRPASHARRVFLSAQELQHPAFLRPDATMPTRQGTISLPTKAVRRPSACGASSPLLPPGPEFTTTRRSRRFPGFITVSSPGWTRFLPRPFNLFARRIDSCRTFGCRRNGPAPAQGTFAQLGRLSDCTTAVDARCDPPALDTCSDGRPPPASAVCTSEASKPVELRPPQGREPLSGGKIEGGSGLLVLRWSPP